MNRELFQLTVQGLRRRRRSSALLFAVLFLSFAFAIVTLSVSGSMVKTNEEYRLDTFGEWMGAIPDGLPEDREFLEQQDWLVDLGTSYTLGTLSNGDKGLEAFGTADEAFLKVGRLGLQDGRMPENPEEIALEAASLSALGYDYTVGQKITVTAAFPAGDTMVPVEHTFTLCGVVKEYNSLWQPALAGWAGQLPAGFVTQETADILKQEAEAQAEKMEQSAQEAIDEAKTAGEAPDSALSSQLNIVLETPMPQYFFTVQEGAENEMQNTADKYLAQGEPPRHKVFPNTLAYGAEQDAEVNTFYAGMIFVVTVLAVLCIYAIQLQKQVRQYALFRSIGIKKSQLRRIVCYETLLLAFPAGVLGVAFGALGTWAVLKLAVYSGSAPIQISIPWALLGILALVWFLGIVLARLVILQIALREPLTGRITLNHKKARRWKRARKALIGALSVLLCGAVVFTVTVSLPSFKNVENIAESRSYQISNGIEGDPLPIITEELLGTLKAVPGVADVWTVGVLEAKLNFEGMENNDFVSLTREAFNSDLGMMNGHLSEYQDGLGVRVYVIPEENYDDFLHPAEIGLDVEAFRKGEQVAVSFPQDINGKFYLTYPIYKEDNGDHSYTVYNERRYASDIGLRAGDAVTLEFFGKEPYTFDENNRRTLYKTDAVVGAIAVISDTGRDIASDGLDSLGLPYVVWCSEEFAKNVFADAADFPGKKSIIGSYPVRRAGKKFGYTRCAIQTNSQAGYVSTDTVVAQLCEQNRLTLRNNREYFAAVAQEYAQTLILLLSTGGCVVCVLLLLLGNSLTLETEREKRKYGILQALGMSKKQLKRRLVKSALLRGLLGILAGWVFMAGYVVYSAYQGYLYVLDGPEELRRTVMESLRLEIERYQVAGADVWFVLLLTAGAILLTAGLSLLTKRSLLKGELMDKLREEE